MCRSSPLTSWTEMWLIFKSEVSTHKFTSTSPKKLSTCKSATWSSYFFHDLFRNTMMKSRKCSQASWTPRKLLEMSLKNFLRSLDLENELTSYWFCWYPLHTQISFRQIFRNFKKSSIILRQFKQKHQFFDSHNSFKED